MTRLKKLVIGALAAVTLSLGGLAATHAMGHRGGKEGHRDPAKMIERMKDKLGLSDQQAAQIKAIYEKNQATMKADRDAIKAAANQDAKKAAFEKMRADMKAVQAQVQPILTPEQLAKWNEFKQKHDGKDGKGFGHRHDAQHGNERQPPQK